MMISRRDLSYKQLTSVAASPVPLIPVSRPLLVIAVFIFFSIAAFAERESRTSTVSATLKPPLTELSSFLNAILQQPTDDARQHSVASTASVATNATGVHPHVTASSKGTRVTQPAKQTDRRNKSRHATTSPASVRSARGTVTVASRSRVAQALSSFHIPQ